MSDFEEVLFIGAGRRSEHADPAFDELTHTWTVPTRSGDCIRARIVIATDGAVPPIGRPDFDPIEPYLGVAVHGLPNYFLITGPDTAAQKRYIAACLQYMADSGSTRIEVRYSTQRTFNMSPQEPNRDRSVRYWRRMTKHIPSAFDASSDIGVDPDLYDGPAALCIGTDRRDVRVRLTGHIDPIDGRYHWQGTVFDALEGVKLPQPATLTVRDRTADARLVERTPQGGYSVAGVGLPPFALDDVEVAVPVR